MSRNRFNRGNRDRAAASSLPPVTVGDPAGLFEDEDLVPGIEEIGANATRLDAVLAGEAPLPDELPEPEPEGDPGEARYVIRARQIDRFNTIRKRVRLTPAVCEVCGVDFVSINQRRLSRGGEPVQYEDLSERQQEDMRALVAEHKRLHHTSADRHIIRESELPKEWLGRR